MLNLHFPLSNYPWICNPCTYHIESVSQKPNNIYLEMYLDGMNFKFNNLESSMIHEMKEIGRFSFPTELMIKSRLQDCIL